MYPRRFLKRREVLKVFKDYSFIKDSNKFIDFAIEFIPFQKITLKPLLAGFILSFLLTSTRAFHTSLCSSLNSIYSTDLLLFTTCTAIFFHIFSPWCKISNFISESIYETAIPLIYLLIGGMTASLIVMNFQENAIPWIDVIKHSIGMSIYFCAAFTFTTTLPYFLLMKKLPQGKNFRETAKHWSMWVTYILFLSLISVYFLETNIFPELDFCEQSSTAA